MQKSNGLSNKSASGFTRRDFVAATLAVPAAAALVGSTYKAAKSQDGVAIRKEVSSLDAAELQVYKDAVQIMRDRPDSDPTSWEAAANFHIQFCTSLDVKQQIHFGWWFLPWHRAYLHFTEMKLRAAVNEPSLAMPYWDWDANPQLPPNYLGEGPSNNPLMGSGNPLADSTRWATPDQILPKDLRNTTEPLRARTFGLFGGLPLIDLIVPSAPGLMESPHNTAHYWAGGNMSDFATTARDPLFYALHANIDRNWDIWVRLPSSDGNPTDPVWLERRFLLTDEKGLPAEIAIKDLLTTESVGYRYDNVKPPASLAASVTGIGPEAAGAVTIEAPRDNKPNVLISEPLTKRLTARAQAPIFKALAAENPKVVVLQLESLEVPQGLVPIYRFFLNRPDADAFTAPEPAEGYVGTIVIVPITGDEVQPRMTVRVMLREGVLKDIAAREENAITIVPVVFDIPQLGIKAGPGPAIKTNFEKLTLSVGE
jgi:polyphenol oxidase